MAGRTLPFESIKDPSIFYQNRESRRLLAVMIAAVIFGGRIAIPLGGSQQIPLVIPFTVGLLLVGVGRGLLIVSAPRLWSYAVTMAILTAVTMCNAALGQVVSLLSIGLTLAIYFLTIVRIKFLKSADVEWLHRFTAQVMTIVAALTLVQFGSQFVGVRWVDWLTKVVPSKLLLTGYNTGNPIYYGSPIYRPNGVFFLEPSFVSFFLGIAIVMAITLRMTTWCIFLMVAALLTTVAGNGFVVVFAGLLVVAFQQKRRALPLLLATVAVIVVTLITPLGQLVLGRTTELSSAGGNTSSAQRLQQPYEILFPQFLKNPASILFGRGPGAANDIITADKRGVGVIAATIPKLLVEYGIIATLAFLLFLCVFLAPGFRRYAFGLGLCINYFIINAGLLQAVIALTTLILLGLAVPSADPRDRTSRRQLPKFLLKTADHSHRVQRPWTRP